MFGADQVDENGQPLKFKAQPWILFDSVVARSFLLGDTSANGLAVGSQIPAISLAGEITFFNGGGRNKATMPWYTNLDLSGQLAYGLEVWQIYVMTTFPVMPPVQNQGFDYSVNPGVPGPVKLAECILHYSVLSLDLGQENQIEFPLARFGAGGGLDINAGGGAVVRGSNGVNIETNVLKLPEPIEMPRTQNLAAKIRIAPEVQAMIGTVAAPGVGAVMSPYVYGIDNGETVTDVELAQVPFQVQLGLVGRRVKYTQYGQVPAGTR
ncbi:MAG TPA: hypothetical protein VJR89_02315 [Polyangiales bacterium]|nr:hypothetical protein [Polyangiales bacterium]